MANTPSCSPARQSPIQDRAGRSRLCTVTASFPGTLNQGVPAFVMLSLPGEEIPVIPTRRSGGGQRRGARERDRSRDPRGVRDNSDEKKGPSQTFLIKTSPEEMGEPVRRSMKR